MAKRLGVHGLVQNTSGLYLIMKRSELDADEADPVGGGIEDGETVEEGFKREVKEEAGLSVSAIKITHAYTIEDNSLQLIVSAEIAGGSVILSEEHNDFKWVTFDELLTISPVSLHLKAIQYMLKNKIDLTRYEDYK